MTDDPGEVLGDYRNRKLSQIWKSCDFGIRYQMGVWNECAVKEHIASWFKDSHKGLVLSGSVGTGKTYALGLMMMCLAAKNRFDFRYEYCPSLFTFLHSYNRDADGHGERWHNVDHSRYQNLQSCQVLFLDDIGREFNSQSGWALSRLDEVMEHRYSHELTTVATTNLSLKTLMARPGWDRIIDRLRGDALAWVEIGGKSKR